MKNAHIINFLKTFSFNPSCKKILDDLEKLNNNKDELDKFVKDKDEDHDIIYKVVLYKNDLSCLIQQIKEDKRISENVYKLLVDGLSEDNAICLIMDFRLIFKNWQSKVHVEYVDCILRNKEDKNDIVFLLDTLVYFSAFAVFLKTWFIQYANLQEELYSEMPDFLWFFKVFLTTQHQNYFEPNFD
mgnify:CR=1 FL=1